MSTLLVLSDSPQAGTDVLPALGLLLHTVRCAPAELPPVLDGPPADTLLVDGRRELVRARTLCRLLRAAVIGAPVVLVVTEGGLAAVTAEWGVDDVVLETAGPAEVEARLRLAAGRLAESLPGEHSTEIRSGDLVIDDSSYTARIRSRPMDLTYKEFELLKFLAQHPTRVFTRAHLLQEVWGFDFFGGTRTVDVHVRRLRAKLGPEHDHLIGTVRNVGYRFVVAHESVAAATQADRSDPTGPADRADADDTGGDPGADPGTPTGTVPGTATDDQFAVDRRRGDRRSRDQPGDGTRRSDGLSDGLSDEGRGHDGCSHDLCSGDGRADDGRLATRPRGDAPAPSRRRAS